MKPKYGKPKQPKSICVAAFPKQFKKLNRVKAEKRSRKREYTKLKKEFLETAGRCPVFPQFQANDLHHLRGRRHSLLIDRRFWLAVSRAGHNWIHQHPSEARKRGFLCAVGQWNKPVKCDCFGHQVCDVCQWKVG